MQARPAGQPDMHLGRRQRHVSDVYMNELGGLRRGGRFRWLVSTCLAGLVGVAAIAIVVYSSIDERVQLFEKGWRWFEAPPEPRQPRADQARRTRLARTDRMQAVAAGHSTKLIIHESYTERRDGRSYVMNRPYARIISRLSTAPTSTVDQIPPFNPFKLYAAPGTEADGGADSGQAGRDVAVKVVELLGGILPAEDSQELDAAEVAELVARADAQGRPGEGAPAVGGQGTLKPGFVPEGSEQLMAEKAKAERAERSSRQARQEPPPPNTLVLQKIPLEADEVDEIEGQEVRVVRVARGDTLAALVRKNGGDAADMRSIVEAARPALQESPLAVGHEVHFTLVPSVTVANRMEPVRVSIFDAGQDHKVTIYRNAAAEWAASNSPIDAAVLSSGDAPQSASLYASLYATALAHRIPQETIQTILRIHAPGIDFKRRVRPGDAVDFFFEVRDADKGADGPPGELLFSAISVGGETKRFYRFRSPDGVVDHYDEQGNNSRKFLDRRPLQAAASEVRFSSGFGMRRHPILGVVRPHNGIDWVAPIGTPILAAAGGTVEEFGRKVDPGNFVRLRHANGYKTVYYHLLRFAPGVREGLAVRQGDVIGYLGNTGLSTAPHLHFEVLINNRHVDPLLINPGSERRLTDKLLQEFQKQRKQIDELMRRPPVMQRTAPTMEAKAAGVAGVAEPKK